MQYQPIGGNQSSDVFYSQIIRYSRICNVFTNFSERVIIIIDDFIKLRRMFVSIVGKHGLMIRFGTECRDILNIFMFWI